MRIGVDFGGVLTATVAPPAEGYLSVPPRDNSYAVLQTWIDEGHLPILISRAQDYQIPKARSWLSHWHFDKLFTGGIEFCPEPEGKIDICRRQKIDVMIDDTPSQLQLLGGVVLHRILFNATQADADILPAPDWKAVHKTVTKL